MRGRAALAVIGLATAALVGASGAAGATSRPAAAQASYCRGKGGAVQVRVPMFGTNNPGGTPLAGSLPFCRFTSAQDGSMISVDLGTLTASKPTLAALAYYAHVRPGRFNPNANPASLYCTRVGGTDDFGGPSNAAGGGWVLRGRGANTVLDLCVFPDRSTIDAFGLFYRSGNVIRGVDLSTVLRFKPPRSG
jgi:putative hemolysin